MMLSNIIPSFDDWLRENYGITHHHPYNLNKDELLSEKQRLENMPAARRTMYDVLRLELVRDCLKGL